MKNKTHGIKWWFQTIFYVFRQLRISFSAGFVCCFLGICTPLLVNFLSAFFPKVVVDLIERQSSIPDFFLFAGGFTLILAGVDFTNSYVWGTVRGFIATNSMFAYSMLYDQKIMDMDYELMEHPDQIEFMARARHLMTDNRGAALNLPCNITLFASSILGFLFYSYTFTTLNLFIVVVLVVTCLANWLFLRYVQNYEKRTRSERSRTGQKMQYLLSVMRDVKGAKDIRLCNLFDWIHTTAEHIAEKNDREIKGMERHKLIADFVGIGMILLRDGVVYLYLIQLMLAESIQLGDFLLYFAMVGQFASWLSQILTSAQSVAEGVQQMGEIRSFLEIKATEKEKQSLAVLDPSMQYGFTFQHVTYQYPGASEPALKDISFQIAPGERIAIVGANGSGKTTLVKLMCGLYQPMSGEIRLNGHNITSYRSEDYFKLISAVFQDFYFLTASVAENVSQAPLKQTNMERVDQCLQQVGLLEKICTFPNQEKTMLGLGVVEDAVELSGGERQRLALARALYKDAPVVVLDEPTAALDPLAERNIYENYNRLVDGKTAVFVSHRLASTKFCDKIILVDNGEIRETGTHASLLAQNGLYAEMFKLQSSYYQTDINKSCL